MLDWRVEEDDLILDADLVDDGGQGQLPLVRLRKSMSVDVDIA